LSAYRFTAPLPLLMLALAASLILALAAQAAALAQELRAAPLPMAHLASYADAVQSFRAQRYAAAYGRFARLADEGHAPSAQLALVMVRNGHALFGNEWSATPEQQRRWSALVVNSERMRLDSADEPGD
jgi:hypothetical protein